MKKILYLIRVFLDKPLWLLMAVFCIVCLYLLIDETFLKMWHLYHSHNILENKITNIQNSNILIKNRLKKLSDFQFLEKEVRDRFNLVGAEDIIFIFADDNKNKKAM